MSYTPTTDFLALLRTTSGGVRTERMPGLDYVVAALNRAGLIALSVGQTAPIVNQPTTVWFQPAVPSWGSEGAVFLWNATAGAYQVATPALWANFLGGIFPATVIPLVDASPGVVGVSTQYARQDHVHPTDTSRAPLAGPVFTGTPQAPTPTIGDNSANIATTAFVQETSGVTPTIGVVLPYAGNTAPNASWQLCQGQAISRTTFANLFSIIGITYGGGDGVTTFNLPDLRGRVSAGVDGGANRLTTTTMTSQALGGTGGAETYTQLRSDIVNVAPTVDASTVIWNTVAGTSGTATSGSTQAVITSLANGGTSGGGVTNYSSKVGINSGSINVQSLNGAVTQTAMPRVQPTIELQMLIRVA